MTMDAFVADAGALTARRRPTALARRVARAGGRFLRMAAASIPFNGAYFAAATTFAALLALYVAFWLGLDSPSTAATTVLIVASPVRGMVLSKSLYRLLGTFIGGAVALILVDLCGQHSELFIAAVAIWVGLCTAVAALFRNFRSYAAVLSGYTVPLIGMAAIQAPDRSFDITSARVAAITVGLACAAFASALLLPGGARKDLIPRLDNAVAMILNLARDTLAQGAGAVGERRFVEATSRILSLDNLIEFAAAESSRAARQADALRSAVGALIGAVTTLRAIADLRSDDVVAGGPLIGDIYVHLRLLAHRLDAGDRDVADLLAAMRARLRGAMERAATETSPSLRELQLLDNLDELVEQLEAVLLDQEAYAAERGARSVAAIDYHVDVETALGNGFRAILGVLAAGGFCYAFGWSDSSQAVVAVAVICSLLAMRPNPAKASVAFAVGVLLSEVAALFCQFGLLASAQGFPLLALSMAPFLFVGLLSPANALLAGVAGGFRVFFVVALSPTNPMVFDAAATLNAMLAMMVGAVFAAYFFRAILPLDESAEPHRLLRLIRDEIARAQKKPAEDRTAFESRLYHLLTILAARLGADQPEKQALLAEAYEQTRLALATQRARIALSADNLSDDARRSYATAVPDAAEAPAFLDAANRLIATMPSASGPDRAALLRAASALAEAAAIAAAPSKPTSAA
jgi:uncharacterized membrane protein YccC